MNKWPRISLGECCQIVSGATPKTGVQEYWDGDIPWATPKDLSGLSGAYIDDTPRKISRSGLQGCAASILPSGSVLLSSRAPIGHVAINSQPMATNQGFKSLVPDSGRVDSKYLYYWLRRNRSYLDSLGSGATFKEISKAVVAGVEVPLPPLSEQRRIAAVLDKVDSLRAKRREAIALLDELSQSVFSRMFDTADEASAASLGDHLSFVTSGGRGWARFYAEKGDRFIRSLDVRMNTIDGNDAVYVDPPDSAEARRTKVQNGDVLLTITGSRIGRVAVVPKDLEGAYISQHVAVLRLDSRKIRPEYLSFYLNMESGGQRQISKFQYGQTKPGLNFRQIRGFRIPVPSLELQDEFIERLSAINSLKSTHQTHLSHLDELFASLQQRAFRGDLWHEAA